MTAWESGRWQGLGIVIIQPEDAAAALPTPAWTQWAASEAPAWRAEVAAVLARLRSPALRRLHEELLAPRSELLAER